MHHKHVVILNRRPEIQRVTGILSAFMEEHDVPIKASFAVDMALDELLTNVISYAYSDELEHEINVSLGLSSEGLSLVIDDDGQPFNPWESGDADTSSGVDERRIGGLGIHFVRTMMNEFEYRREAGRNIITMRKRFDEETDLA